MGTVEEGACRGEGDHAQWRSCHEGRLPGPPPPPPWARSLRRRPGPDRCVAPNHWYRVRPSLHPHHNYTGISNINHSYNNYLNHFNNNHFNNHNSQYNNHHNSEYIRVWHNYYHY